MRPHQSACAAAIKSIARTWDSSSACHACSALTKLPLAPDFETGADSLNFFAEGAAPLISARLSVAAAMMRRDLHNNAAQAALQLREWDQERPVPPNMLADPIFVPVLLAMRSSCLRTCSFLLLVTQLEESDHAHTPNPLHVSLTLTTSSPAD